MVHVQGNLLAHGKVKDYTVLLKNKRPKIYMKYLYAFAHTGVCVSAYLCMLISVYGLAYCFFFSL